MAKKTLNDGNSGSFIEIVNDGSYGLKISLFA